MQAQHRTLQRAQAGPMSDPVSTVCSRHVMRVRGCRAWGRGDHTSLVLTGAPTAMLSAFESPSCGSGSAHRYRSCKNIRT